MATLVYYDVARTKVTVAEPSRIKLIKSLLDVISLRT